MAENVLLNDDKQNIAEKVDNSDEDLIQFSHSEYSHLENENRVFNNQAFKPSSQHNAGMRLEANNGEQKSTKNMSAKPKVHSEGAVYPPNLANLTMSFPRIGERAPTSLTSESPETKAAKRCLTTQSFPCHSPYEPKQSPGQRQLLYSAQVPGHQVVPASVKMAPAGVSK